MTVCDRRKPKKGLLNESTALFAPAHARGSKKRRVLETIPEKERSKEVNSLDLSHGHLPIERALGVQWLVDSDELGFNIILKDKPLTGRGILSTISSIYDPLGMAAPILLPGKKILQDLC